MIATDDERPTPAPALGADLSAFSVHELSDLADRLRAEIVRIEAARDSKEASRTAADAVFGTPPAKPR